MHKDIKKYLKQMCRKIKKRPERIRAFREIGGHLLEKVDSLQTEGINYDQAVTQVLKEATPPKILGAKLNAATKYWLWRRSLLALTLASPLISFVWVVLVGHFIIHQYIRPEVEKRLKAEMSYYPHIKKDLELLSENKLFPDRPRINNAAMFLANKIPIAYVESGSSIDKKFSKNFELLNRKFYNWSGDRDTLLKLFNSDDLTAIDTAWVEKLHNFDHWNFMESPLWLKKIERAENQTYLRRITMMTFLPIPDSSEFSSYIIVYALPTNPCRAYRQCYQFNSTCCLSAPYKPYSSWSNASLCPIEKTLLDRPRALSSSHT